MLQRRRRGKNALALAMSLAAMAFGLLWLVWILFTTLKLGIGGLSIELFTQSTPPPNTDGGGLANAIVGSLMLVVLATFIGTPLGILAGVYLAEYGQKRWLASVTRFINDILLSAPSIVIGLFVYALVVAKMGRFSRLGRRDRARAAADPDRDPHDREHAEARAERAARGGLRARHAEVEDGAVDHAEGVGRRAS